MVSSLPYLSFHSNAARIYISFRFGSVKQQQTEKKRGFGLIVIMNVRLYENSQVLNNANFVRFLGLLSYVLIIINNVICTIIINNYFLVRMIQFI